MCTREPKGVEPLQIDSTFALISGSLPSKLQNDWKSRAFMDEAFKTGQASLS